MWAAAPTCHTAGGWLWGRHCWCFTGVAAGMTGSRVETPEVALEALQLLRSWGMALAWRGLLDAMPSTATTYATCLHECESQEHYNP
jgi:hypothetical protein